MIGLFILLFFWGYGFLSIWAIKRARRWARESGKSPARWGWVAAIGMWALLFGDWTPTVLVHRYYCAHEAGLFEYKTLEQWAKENGAQARGLRRLPWQAWGDESATTLRLNDRLSTVARHEPPSAASFLNIRKNVQSIVDEKTGEELIRKVDFSIGRQNVFALGARSFTDYKFWMSRPSCFVTPEGSYVANRQEVNVKFSELQKKAANIGEEIRK